MYGGNTILDRWSKDEATRRKLYKFFLRLWTTSIDSVICVSASLFDLVPEISFDNVSCLSNEKCFKAEVVYMKIANTSCHHTHQVVYHTRLYADVMTSLAYGSKV